MRPGTRLTRRGEAWAMVGIVVLAIGAFALVCVLGTMVVTPQ